MGSSLGRREAKKLAVRSAVQQTARRLFAEQGFEATSVRQIAAAAGVAERTFYRHFDGKASLIAADADRWMELLAEAIRRRPPSEDAFSAVRHAVVAIAREVGPQRHLRPLWLFSSERQPHELLWRSASRPLLRFEEAITSAILERSAAAPGSDAAFEAALIARVCVAVLRSTAIRRLELEATGGRELPPVDQLIDDTFARLGAFAVARRSQVER
jgi:AcrR family transcriptional regulator